MEIVDLSNEDPKIKAENYKQLRKKFNDLKKYIPFLKYIFKSDPENNSKYKILLDWLKITHPCTLDPLHVISCENTIKRRYEKLKNITIFPMHIKELFEGGVSIIISVSDDDDDTTSPCTNDKVLSNDNERIRKNVRSEEKNSTPSIFQSSEDNTQTETLSIKHGTKNLLLNPVRTVNNQANSLSKMSSKSQPKNSSIKINKFDSNVFDIASWDDFEKVGEKRALLKDFPSSKGPTRDQNIIVSKMRKKKQTKNCSNKADNNNKEIEHQSYESLVKKKKAIIKLLKEDLEKPQELDLFKRRDPAKNEKTISDVDSSIINSVKCVLNKNPKVIANVVNDDSLGTKIVYDYSNVTKIPASKIMTLLHKEKNYPESRPPQLLHIDKITPINQSTETKNNSHDGDLYRKAIQEEQFKPQFQVSMQEFPKTYSSKVSETKRTNSTKTLETSNLSGPKQKQESDHGNRCELMRKTESKSSSLIKQSIETSNTLKNPTKKLKASPTTPKSVNNSEELKKYVFLKNNEDKQFISKKEPISEKLEGVNIVHKKTKIRKDQEKDTPRKSFEHSKAMKPKHVSSSNMKPGSDAVSSKVYIKTAKPKADKDGLRKSTETLKINSNITNPMNNSKTDPVLDLNLKKKNRESVSSLKNDTPTKKRKNSVNQDHNFTLKKKLCKIGDISVSSKSDARVMNDSVETENKKNSNRSADNSYKKDQKDSKIKHSKGTINNVQPKKEPIVKLRKLKLKNNPLVYTTYNSDSLDIHKEGKSRQSDAKSKDSTSQTIQLQHNSATTDGKKNYKRKSSRECTGSKEFENQSVKKSKMSIQPNKDITSTKITNSPARRFYRELSNLTCTFKESLLPQTIGRRRCSSSWLNSPESVDQTTRTINAELTPAPIKRRRQTYCEMLSLKLTLQRSSTGNDEYHIKSYENNKSADGKDTDEFDNNEHRRRGDDETNNNNNNNNSKETLSSSHFDPMPIETATIQITKSLANTDSKMTFKSTRTCVLCDKNSNDLTNHYVVKHKTESYVSRLSSNDLDTLKKVINAALPVSGNRYRITCVFCKQMVEDHFENLSAHFSYHTGEYNFQCEGCKIKKPYKEDIGSHQLRSRVCRNSEIIMIHKNDLDTDNIYLNVCKICNFVNMNESNLKNHIQKQHGSNSNVVGNFEKCILLVKKLKPVGSKNSNNCETDEAPLCAEKELTINIQNILMEEDKSVPKTVVRLKCDTTLQSECNETAPFSPEKLLEEMHSVPTKPKGTNQNLINKVSSLNERNVNIATISENSKKRNFNCELPMEMQNHSDSESVTNIEEYIKSTTTISSPSSKNSDNQDCGLKNSIIFSSKEKHSKSPVKMNLSLGRVFTLKTSSPRTIRDNCFEVIDALQSIDDIHNTSICPMDKCLEIVNIPDADEDSSQLLDKHIEDIPDTESITSIEAYIKSTDKTVFQNNSETCIQENQNSKKSFNGKTNKNCTKKQEELNYFNSNVSMEEVNQFIEKFVEGPHLSEKPTHTQVFNKIMHHSSLSVETESQSKAMEENIRNMAASMKCPDCSYKFSSISSIKSHLQMSHPATFQRFSSLNSNQLTGSDCKKVVQDHLSFNHPDQTGFVIDKILNINQSELQDQDNGYDQTVVDISADVLETGIKIVEEIVSLNNEDQETEHTKIEKLISNQDSINSNNCTIKQRPEEILGARTNTPPNSSLNLAKATEDNTTTAQLSESLKNDHYALKLAEPSFIEIEQVTNIESKKQNNFSEAIVSKELDERLKCLLELLVEETGVHRSTLFRCPCNCNSTFMHFELWLNHIKIKHKGVEDVICPYCTEKLQSTSAETHFKNHLQHELICYYCIKSSPSKEQMQEHFASFHENCHTIQLPIASFHLVIKEDAIKSDHKTLVKYFFEAIKLHLIKQIQRNTVNEWTVNGLTDTCLNEMEIPQFKSAAEAEGQSLFKCFEKLCSFVATEENLFDDHLIKHELSKTFLCKHCTFQISNPSLESLKCHHLQHFSSSLLVCCVCKFVHYNSDGIMEHIQNQHNRRDVPVLRVLRSELNYKVSLSIFLPPNEITFSTTKVCYCCAKEIRNSKKYLFHLKKVHKLSLCLRCQVCEKIILTHLEAETHHCKDHQSLEPFKLKFEVLTPYLYDLILGSRSPLTMGVRLRKEKSSDHRNESSFKESVSAPPPVAVKKEEEILIKGELEENKQTPSISIKCLHTNKLLEDITGKEKDINTPQHLRQFNESESSTQHIQIVDIGQNTSSQTYDHSPHLESITNEVAHSIPTTTPRCNFHSMSQLYPESQSFLNGPKDSLSLHLEAEHQLRAVEGSQRIPVITTRVAQPNIQPPTNVYTAPLYNHIAQANIRTNLEEIAPICGTCDLECTDFIELQSHYEATHAVHNQCFFFYVDRKIGCMHCAFQGSLQAFSKHHATLHADRRKLCYSVTDPTRCGMCNDIFRYLLESSASTSSYSLPPLCACPGRHQRALADCLNLPILKTLQDIGYKYYRYSCDDCRISFQSPQQFVQHYITVHHKFIDPQVWRTRLKYYCCMCPSTVSYSLFEVIYHMRFSHLIPKRLSLIKRIECYKRIRIAHPNGFLVSLEDLRNTGQFDGEDFKQKIYNFEAQYRV